jgi:hypothetical protein
VRSISGDWIVGKQKQNLWPQMDTD